MRTHQLMRVWVIFFSVIVCTIQDAQADPNFFGKYTLYHWDTKNGLPSDLVLSANQSKDGFIWLTGYTGLIRFDGVTFTSFTTRNVPLLKSDNIHAITESSDSTLWISTVNSGLLTYKKGVFRQFVPDIPFRDFIAETKKGEYLLSQNSAQTPFIVVDTHTGDFKKLTLNERDSLVLDQSFYINRRTDSEGGIWVGNSRLIQRIADGKTQLFPFINNINENGQLFDLFVDSRDRVWLLTSKDLFIKEDSTFKRYAAAEPTPFQRYADKAPRLILEDQSGGIWIAHASGLAYLAADSDNFVHLPDDHPLRTVSITDMMEDREGNIWLSSVNGLYRFSKGKFTVYSEEEGLGSRNIRGISTFKAGGYVVGTVENRLYEINDGIVLPLLFRDPEIQANLVNIFVIYTDSKQNIWVGASIGSVRISKNGEKVFDNNIRYVFEDSENTLWFGIPGKGIAFLNDNDELEFLKLPKIDFSSVFISSIRKLANQNWLLTTFDNGILLIDPEGNLVINEATKELKNVTVFFSYEDEDGVVWLTTSSGLYRYKNEILTRTGYESGMPELSAFNFLPDKLGYVWFPTNKGVMRAKKQEIDDYLDNKIEQINWRLFDQGDGMRSRASVGSRHSAISPDGKILIPTFDGLLEIDPSKLNINELPPPVVIHGFSWNDESLSLNDLETLQPGNHRLVFEYSALSLTAPEKVASKFRLIGYDNEWITASGDRRAIYTNLPFGEYTFQVIASNNDGIWNEEGASLHFEIAPPWWRTWFAYGFYALFFIGAIYSVDNVQRKRLLKKEHERAREKELAQAKEIEQAYINLEAAHENLKSAQSQLIQQEKLASLGQLTAGIAHEIKNPLNFVNNFSNVSLEMIDEAKEELCKAEDPALALDVALVLDILSDIKLNLQKIHEHGSRADGIVKSMLQHSRGGTGKMEPTDLNALVKEFANLAYHGMRAGKDPIEAEVTIDLDGSIGEVPLVYEDFSRVILNICTNAFDAMRMSVIGDQGSVIGEQGGAHLHVRTRHDGNSVAIEIEDNGPGIPDDIKDKILQPFFTTKKGTQGTGLGLSITHDIVKAHGGNMEIQSKPGQTIFTIRLIV